MAMSKRSFPPAAEIAEMFKRHNVRPVRTTIGFRDGPTKCHGCGMMALWAAAGFPGALSETEGSSAYVYCDSEFGISARRSFMHGFDGRSIECAKENMRYAAESSEEAVFDYDAYKIGLDCGQIVFGD